MTRPAISVCVPSYNGAAHIRECLDSVMAQSFTDFEVLVIDDCSTDGTVDIVHSYLRRDSRVRLLRNPKNLGMRGVPNSNRCFAEAASDWIKFVFQDDVVARDCLRELTQARPRTPGLVFSDRGFIFEDTAPKVREFYEDHRRTLRAIHARCGEISADRFGDLVLEHVGLNLVGEPTTVLVHRGLVERVGAFNPYVTSGADAEFWARVGTNVGAVRVDAELASFRIHGSSTSGRNLAPGRRFRLTALDPTVMCHEFAFHPAYERLRERARRRRPRMDFEQLFWRELIGARREMRRITHGPDRALATEVRGDWNEVAGAYPRFNGVPARYWMVAGIRAAARMLLGRRRRAGRGRNIPP